MSCSSVPSILKRWGIFLALFIIYLIQVSFICLFVPCWDRVFLQHTNWYWTSGNSLASEPRFWNYRCTLPHWISFCFHKTKKKIIFLETQVDKNYASGDWWFVALRTYKKRKRKQRIPFWYSCHGGQVQFTSFPFLTGQLSWLWDEARHTYMYRYILITTQHNMTDIGTEEFMMKWFSSTLSRNGFCGILFLTDCTAHFLLITFSLDLKFMTILNNCLWK